MTVTLSIKNVPEELAQRLKERAARNHRSLQGELMAIIEEAGRPVGSIRDFARYVDRLGLKTPSESASMVRADRDDPRR
jgi:plasmid stability protein